MKNSVEIIKNLNGVHLFYSGSSLSEIILSLTALMVGIQENNNKYSDHEKQSILTSAEHDCKSFMYVLSSKKFPPNVDFI